MLTLAKPQPWHVNVYTGLKGKAPWFYQGAQIDVVRWSAWMYSELIGDWSPKDLMAFIRREFPRAEISDPVYRQHLVKLRAAGDIASVSRGVYRFDPRGTEERRGAGAQRLEGRRLANNAHERAITERREAKRSEKGRGSVIAK